MLRGHLRDIDEAPSPGASVTTSLMNMHDVAVNTFPRAFLRGKRQSMGSLARLEPHDSMWIQRKLSTNQHHLVASLGTDLIRKISDMKINQYYRPGELERHFGPRVENMYGGHLWTVHEAGFRSGANDLNYVVNTMGFNPLYQDDTPSQDDDDEKWKDMAALLGMSVGDLRDEWQSLMIGVEYVTQHDSRVCGGCEAAAGVYFSPHVAPLPGEVCVGGPNCRCYLQTVAAHPGS